MAQNDNVHGFADSNEGVFSIGAITDGEYLKRSGNTIISGTPAGSGGGLLVQYVETVLGTVATGTTLIPIDNTIPQSNEGNQYLSVSITPKTIGNQLFVSVLLNVCHTIADTYAITALFKNDDVNALATGFISLPNANRAHMMTFNYSMIVTSLNAITFKVRAGGSVAGTLTVNGVNSTAFFGGTLQSRIRVTELSPNT